MTRLTRSYLGAIASNMERTAVALASPVGRGSAELGMPEGWLTVQWRVEGQTNCSVEPDSLMFAALWVEQQGEKHHGEQQGEGQRQWAG